MPERVPPPLSQNADSLDPASMPPPFAPVAAPPDGEAPPVRTRQVVRRRLTPLLLFFAALTIVGYFVFTAVDGVVNNNSLDLQIAALEGEIAELEWQADQLSALVAFLDSDEYIERAAREELGYVRVGEESFAIEAPTQTGLPITRSPWWANLLPMPRVEADAEP
jgi:cell division protein FtsB